MTSHAPHVSTAKSTSNDLDPLVDMLERCLRIRTTPQELDSPTSDFIVNVLRAACLPFGLKEEAMNVPLFHLPPDKSHIEDSVPVVHYLKLMQVLFYPLGVTDIGLTDLMKPKAKRTRELLKILVDSWPRMTAIYTKYKEKETKQLLAKNEATKIAIALSTKTEEAKKLASFLIKASEEAEQIEKEHSACDKSLQELCDRKAAIMADNEELESAFAASTEAIKRAELDIVKLKEAIEQRAALCRLQK